MNTKVLRMAEMSKLEIPVRNKTIKLSDAVIFKKLMEKYRDITDADSPAEKGDYVLATVKEENREDTEVHVELGKDFMGLDSLFTGCKPNDILTKETDGHPVTYHIESVRRIVDVKITDKWMEQVQPDGITTIEKYRNHYVQTEGKRIASGIFHSLREMLSEQMVALTEFSIDEAEQNRYCEMFEKMICKMNNGDLDGKLLEAYGQNGKYDVETCRNMFREDNKRAFLGSVIGKDIADLKNKEFTEEMKEQCYGFYGYVYDMSPEDIEKNGKQEEAMMTAYSSFFFETLEDYYCSAVQFVTEK